MTLNKNNHGIIIFLSIIIVVIGFLTFNNYKDYLKLQHAFNTEKVELENELNKMITDYDKAISDKISTSKKLRAEQFKIIQFRDTIKKLQEKNYNLIRIYRKRIQKLEAQNRLLFSKVDSLNEANTYLQVENIAVRGELNEKNRLTHKLYESNKNLIEDQTSLLNTVKKARLLKVNNVQVTPMKKRNSGKFTSTSRAKKTEAFKITLTVLKNEIAKEGERKVYVQIANNNKKVISPNGSLTLKNGSKITYSDYFVVDYKKTEASLVSFVEVPKGSVQHGKCLIKVYLENNLAGYKMIELR